MKISEAITSLEQQLDTLILGKQQQTRLALACLLADGHLLIEDLPGMGKTTLAQGLAKILGLDFQRVQFTSDLLPADILGGSIFQPEQGKFHFHPGPVFTQVLLADEINRASPKTQSALLEAMGEKQISVDGETHTLPVPFFVIATQNPFHQKGTFPLPESQLDRFMLRLSLGYPSMESERVLLEGGYQNRLEEIKAIIDVSHLQQLQQQVYNVTASGYLLDYLQRLVQFTRESELFTYGLSPRGALSWLHCAKAWAFIHQRGHVLPDDLQDLMVPVIAHRLLPKESVDSASEVIEKMKQEVEVL